ncbi:MAG: SAF domain-containing protein [Anaerolineae bacterium]|nr:SAF domain-containing protein [Anaerolineae bacterium]
MGRLRGYLWLIAGIVVAAIAGGIAFITLSNAVANRVLSEDLISPEQDVVIAVQALDIGVLITNEDVRVIQVPIEIVPEDALTGIDQVVGKLTLAAISPGEMIMGGRLVDPNVIGNDGRTALVLSEDKVLMAYPASDLMSGLDILKPGDHVDFLYTLPLPIDRETGFLPGVGERTSVAVGAEEGETLEPVTFNLLQNVVIASIVFNVDEDGVPTGSPRGLLVTVNPQDALVLKYMKDAGAIVDLVLRAPRAEGTFSVEPVDLDFVINGYIVPSQSAP